DIWSLLPLHEELIEGVRVFLTTCLQIGFIPKALFLEQLETNRDSVNVFLLLSMLGISARFTPPLCDRFKGSKAASEFFLDVAHILIADEMFKTSLENAQAFFLLGMADWGRGDRDRSAINMGIAVRMAAVMRLHREETYQLPVDATADQVVEAERARRTFWVIQNHDNLYTQQHLPRSFSKADITALLPCDESDFAFGRRPRRRAALAGTRPSHKDPSLKNIQERSLFATLVQAHDLWGVIARDASRDDSTDSQTVDPEPWTPDSHYMRTAKMLSEFEDHVPREQKWSPWNLRGYKAEHVDLAYLSIVTITRLNNIVLRRAYMDRIVKSASGAQRNSGDPSAPPGFWENVSQELFSNAWELYEAVEMWFSLRSNEDGFPAMLAFCIYICGSLASHRRKWPGLCPRFYPEPSADAVLQRSLEVLSLFEDKWSSASQWYKVLQASSSRHESRNQVGVGPRPQTEVVGLGVRDQEPGSRQPVPTVLGVDDLCDPGPISSGRFQSQQPRNIQTPAIAHSRSSSHITSPLPVDPSLADIFQFPTNPISYDQVVVPANIPFSLPISPDMTFLHSHPLEMDINFADVIQGYLNLGCNWPA
ncbi:hypothetical protein QBC39DRAFT_250398, partial [Podospora conica]